jgi:hypothetical protein
MSFSGGGQSPLINHVHDNNPGSGGALSTTLTLMGPDVLYTLLTANTGKWSATNTATFRTSVLAGVQSGTIEEVS